MCLFHSPQLHLQIERHQSNAQGSKVSHAIRVRCRKVQSPVHVEGDTIESVRMDFLEDIGPSIGVGKSPRMKLSG